MIKTIDQAWQYLSSLIMSQQVFSAEPAQPFRRAAHLMELLGNPQNKIRVIHIAGTSGKGSTAFYLSRLLHAHGFAVGLHISPHLTDIRERFQINNELVTNDTFLAYLNKVKNAASRMKDTELGHPSYFELLVALSFLLFHERRVDYAVIETGMGGWYDATNTATRPDKLCIITPIGLDHTNVLGTRIEQIALQKAKIIHQGNEALSVPQADGVRRVIEQVAHEENATLQYVSPKHRSRIRRSGHKMSFSFREGKVAIQSIMLNTPALYQVDNASTSLFALCKLALRDGFAIKTDKVRSALLKPSFAGRMETVTIKGKKAVVDGAHNEQKMETFIASLKAAYPRRKFHFLVAFKKGKDYRKMLSIIIPVAKKINVTNFTINVQDNQHFSEEPVAVASAVVQTGRDIEVMSFRNPEEALNTALYNMPERDILVITGSLYLISCLYPQIHENTHHQ